MADLSRQTLRARHARARFLDEWDQILKDSTETQAVLDSAASKKIEIGQASTNASLFERFTIHTPYTRYLYAYHFMPYLRICLGVFFSLASFCIVWSEIIKLINPYFSIIAVTVVHHPTSERGEIGIGGQMIASCWILYMCAAAMTSLTEVKVWRGRALVRRNTHGESAMWYAMQVAKLTVPISYNFLTFLAPAIYKETVFYKFLGILINLTPLGTWFDWLFPAFILVPIFATLFGLYGKVKTCFGIEGIIEDDEEDNEPGLAGYGTGSWREGRNLIERELQGHSSLGRLDQAPRHSVPNNPNNRSAPFVAVPPANRQRALGTPSASRTSLETPRPSREPEDENFLEGFAHRVKNTMDTVQTPNWFKNIGEGIQRPAWMGGNEEASSSNQNSVTRWFGGGRQDGRVRL